MHLVCGCREVPAGRLRGWVLTAPCCHNAFVRRAVGFAAVNAFAGEMSATRYSQARSKITYWLQNTLTDVCCFRGRVSRAASNRTTSAAIVLGTSRNSLMMRLHSNAESCRGDSDDGYGSVANSSLHTSPNLMKVRIRPGRMRGTS